ncbi:hypothetical protein M514_10645, partial [Trichuris suis]
MLIHQRTRSYSSFGRGDQLPFDKSYLKNSQDDYGRMIHRSFSSAQDLISHYNSTTAPYYDFNLELHRYLTRPRNSSYFALNPFYPITHAIEDYPTRRYDVYTPGLWTYPLWKYLYDPGHKSYYYRRRDEASRSVPYYPSRLLRASYLAGEMNYYSLDLNRALDNYRFWRRSYQTVYPNYRYYYGDHGLRHFGGYRSYILGYPLRTIWL